MVGSPGFEPGSEGSKGLGNIRYATSQFDYAMQGLVGEVGFEPTVVSILSALRLPISPLTI